MTGFLFIVLAAVFLGVWMTLNHHLMTGMPPLMAIVIIAFVYLMVGFVFLVGKSYIFQEAIERPSLGLCVLAAIIALVALVSDFSMLRAYELRLPITIGAPVYFGGAILVAALIGVFFLGEKMTLTKMLGMSLIILGTIFLARESSV